MENKKTYIKSPLNYTGGKFKLLSQILPLFPKDINVFLEPFAGGLNVSLNVNANSYILNDASIELIELWKFLEQKNENEVIMELKELISYYDLSLTNVDGFQKLRNDRNIKKDNELLLFLLICYGFNHQLRFNKNGDFNIPFGKERSCYNGTIENNLIHTMEKLHIMKPNFSSKDFRKIDYSILKQNDFVYVDPPYLITQATYNGDWGIQEEKDLLHILTSLNEKQIRFALSNVLEHHGKTNTLLFDWAKEYNIHYLSMNYGNSNYHKKNKDDKSIEVLITNY